MKRSITAMAAGAVLSCAMLSSAMTVPAFAAGSTSGSGSGALAARGSGTAQISGDVDAMRITGRGVLVVVDRAGDAVVTVSGTGAKRSVTKDGVTTHTYAGFHGAARISGSDVTVRLVGTNVTLVATGDGSFRLTGTGVYDTKPTAAGGEGTWKGALVSL